MAEFVNRRLERSLGELEEMVRVGLFKDTELKAIIAKRKRLEYGVQRYEKSVEDHLKYIKYEMDLLDLIKLRRTRLGYNLKFSEIEGSIGKRCQGRLMKAETKFPSNMAVWNLHVELCKKLGWNPAASHIFTRMLQIHSDKPEIWIQAATFELEENGSPDNARALCLRALRWHEHNEKMWIHYLSTEIRIAMKVLQRAEILNVPASQATTENDAITNGKVAALVAANAVRTIGTATFGASLCELVLKLAQSEELPEELWRPVVEAILENMISTFGNTADCLFHRARIIVMIIKWRKDVTEHDAITAEDEAFGLLDQGLAENNTDPVWQSYMDFLIELESVAYAAMTEWRELPRKRFQKDDQIFAEADRHGRVDFAKSLAWASLCLKRQKKDKALEILKNTAAKQPKSADDYHSIISVYEVMEDQRDAIVELVRQAERLVEPKGVEFWKSYFGWMVQYIPQEAEAAFHRGLKQARPVIAATALHYVQWAYDSSLAKGRQIYWEIHRSPGVLSEEFVRWVVKEEKSRSSPVSLIRKLLDDALLSLGSTSVDLWMDYLHVESKYPGGDPLKISALSRKAQRCLQPALVGLFTSMCTLLMLESGKELG